MVFTSNYDSPLGAITLACDEEAIIGLWFRDRHGFGYLFPSGAAEGKHPLLEAAARWLDLYFSGKNPDFLPPLKYGSTPFQRAVCECMLKIPYGQTVSYGEIADEIARETGVPKMSAQAVGGAVGHNPISIMIPCHRVVGKNGSLTGYGGGLDRKIALLTLEGVDMSRFFLPKK